MERGNYGRGRGRGGGGGWRGGRGGFGRGGGGRVRGRDQHQHQYHYQYGHGGGGRDQQQQQHYQQQGHYRQYNQGGGGQGTGGRGGGRDLGYTAPSTGSPPAQQWGPPRSYGSAAGESSARGGGGRSAWGPSPGAWLRLLPPLASLLLGLLSILYDMCFTFARCTKPVSLVPLLYYADLVAYRVWMYREVVASFPPGSAVSSSSSGPSFDERFYRLHPELENKMYCLNAEEDKRPISSAVGYDGMEANSASRC